MSNRERAKSQNKPGQSSKSDKRGVKPRFTNPIRKEKSRACTVPYNDHGYTSDTATASIPTSRSPYDVMRNSVEITINTAKILNMEKNLTLNNCRGNNKSAKGKDVHESSSQSGVPAPLSFDDAQEVEVATYGKGDDYGNTRSAIGSMAGNEDDEEYQMEEEEAERIISQGLSLQNMMALAYQSKKSITEQMREFQVSMMERTVKKIEPDDLMTYFNNEGYFNYNYDQDARYTPPATGNGTKKDNLYVIIGLTRKVKAHD